MCRVDGGAPEGGVVALPTTSAGGISVTAAPDLHSKTPWSSQGCSEFVHYVCTSSLQAWNTLCGQILGTDEHQPCASVQDCTPIVHVHKACVQDVHCYVYYNSY